MERLIENMRVKPFILVAVVCLVAGIGVVVRYTGGSDKRQETEKSSRTHVAEPSLRETTPIPRGESLPDPVPDDSPRVAPDPSVSQPGSPGVPVPAEAHPGEPAERAIEQRAAQAARSTRADSRATVQPRTDARSVPQAAAGGRMYRSMRGEAWLQRVSEDRADTSVDPSRTAQSSPEHDQRERQAESPYAEAVEEYDASDEIAQRDDYIEEDIILTPIDVVQIARFWEEDQLQVSFAMLLDQDEFQVKPNGLIVAQQIPPGWHVVDAVPPIEAVDEENRIVKWLFVGDDVRDNTIYSMSMRADEGAVDDWDETRAWFTYRRPDGQAVEVATVPHPDSAIQTPP